MSLLPTARPKYHPIQQETDDPKRQETDDPKRQETDDPKRQETQDPIKCDCIRLTATIFLLLVIYFFWFVINLIIFETLIGTSNDPKFHVDDVTLTQFKLSPKNNILYYNLAVNMTFRNPNSKVGIHYDKIKVTAMYHGQRLTTKNVQGFYVGHKKENNNVNAFFNGERPLVLHNGDEKALYESESKDGVYEIDLKLRLKMRLRTLSWDTFQFESKVVCHLKVPLSSQGKVPFAKFERTRCVYKTYDY